MKTTVIIRRNEVAAINDVLGTYGSKKRITEIAESQHGIVVSGSFDTEGNYILEFKIRRSLTIGLCQIAMNHAGAIKGLVKTLNGIIETINYISKSISRDVKNLFKEYEEE